MRTVAGTTDTHRTECLLADYRRTGDRRIRNEVVEAHLRLAGFTVRRFARGNSTTAEDLQQVALMAIVHAAERYRPGKGASFRTFARRTIDGEIKRYLRDRSWTVRPPRSRQEHFLQVCRADEELAQQLRRSATDTEIAARADLSVKEVIEAMKAGGARSPSSLAPGRNPDDTGSVRPELVRWDRNYDALESHLDLRRAVARLDQRERRVLHLRFVDDRSQPEIAELLHISQSYVSRIIRGALAKLRCDMATDRSVHLVKDPVLISNRVGRWEPPKSDEGTGMERHGCRSVATGATS